MATKAERLEERLRSKDHWAKPFYSDVHVFNPGAPRIFIGLNPGGDKGSRKYYEQDSSEDKIWSGHSPYYNDYLDGKWEGYERGQRPLQIAARRVFESMYGASWEDVLRNTPCFNLVPVCSEGSPHSKLKPIWNDSVMWGIELIKHLRPQSIILYTNGNSNTPWAALRSRFGLRGYEELSLDVRLRKSLKQGVLNQYPLKDVPVVGLPHLTSGMNEQVRKKIYNYLTELAEQCPFP